MGIEDLADEQNPLGPEAIIDALDRTCGESATDTAAKRSLLSAFQPYIADGMTDVYAEVNAMLVARNILPKIKPAIQRSVGTSSLPGSLPGLSALTDALGRTGPNSLAQLLNATQPMNLLDGAGQGGMSTSQAMRLSGMVSGPQGSIPKTTGPNMPSIGLSAEATAALAQIAVGPRDARRHIVRMLAEPSRHSFDAAIATPATPQLLQQLSVLQDQLSLTGNLTQSWLRALDQDVRNQSHPLDQLTIDFVAALFDIIFHDKSISDAVKAEIARMQIVVSTPKPAPDAAAPKSFYLVTGDQTFRVTLPGDGALMNGSANTPGISASTL